MAAFFIAHRREITDSEKLEAYDGVDATLAKFGGKVEVRADRFEVLEGHWHSGSSDTDAQPERITIIAFPDMAKLKAWYGSPEYSPLKQLREKSSTSDIIAVVTT